MVRTFTFSRSTRDQQRVTRNEKKDRPEKPGPKVEEQGKRRFKRHKEVLDKMNMTLMSKMEELRVLPESHSNDQIGSFFFDELEFFNTTESTLQFRGLYHEIVDRSQTLPLILLNKKLIVEAILSRYQERYFQPICSKLLVALIRDCGEDLFDLFLAKVVPLVAGNICVKELQTVEIGFRVFASALKFMSKVLQKKLVQFVKVFVGLLLQKRNVHIRRFTAEAVAFIFGRIRQKKELVDGARQVLALSLEDYGITEATAVMAQVREDFNANLLYLLLKGDQGSISPQGRDLLPLVAEILATQDSDSHFCRKTINMLIENEYKFFRARQDKASKSVGEVVFLEDFLDGAYELDPEGDVMTKNLLGIMTEILLFGSGQRFTEKLADLSERILKRSSRTTTESGIIFVTKFLSVKNAFHPYILALTSQRLSATQIALFLSNLFNKGTFTRTCVHKGFNRARPDDIVVPRLGESITAELTLFIVKCINVLLEEPGRDQALALFLLSVYLEGNIGEMKLNLDKQDVAAMTRILQAGAETEHIIYKIGILKILLLTKNVEVEPDLHKTMFALVERATKSIETQTALPAETVVDLDRIYEDHYLDQLRTRTNNFDINNEADLRTHFACYYLQVYLKFDGLAEKSLATVYPRIEQLLLRQDNYTIVIQTYLSFRRATLSLSKKEGRPVGPFAGKKPSGGFVFAVPESLQPRVLRYLWSEIPDARICALKLLIDMKSALYLTLHALDTTEVNFYKERELFLQVDQLATDLYYGKIEERDFPVLFHFFMGFSSHRITTLIPPMMDLVAQLVLAKHEFFEQLMAFVLQLADHARTGMVCPEEDHRYMQKLIRPHADYVDFSVRVYRLLEWLEGVVGYCGNRRNRDGHKVEGEIKDSLDMKILYPEASSGQKSNQLKEKKLAITTKLFRYLELLLEHEGQHYAVPSLAKHFRGTPESERQPRAEASLEQVFESVKANTHKEQQDTDSKPKRRFCLERIKKLLRALKSSPELGSLEGRPSLQNYLLEIMKFPAEEIQLLALQTFFKLTKDNKIVKQFSAVLTSLTVKDSFKENLMTFSEKFAGLSMMERAEIVPILNSLLYRRLVDRTGLSNYRHFASIKDFIFDTVSSYTDSEKFMFLECVSSTASISLPVTSLAAELSTVSISRIVAYFNILESAISRITFGEQYTMSLMDFFSKCVTTSTQVLEKFSAFAKKTNRSTTAAEDFDDISEEEKEPGDEKELDEEDGLDEDLPKSEEQPSGVEEEQSQDAQELENELLKQDKLNYQALKQFKVLRNAAFKRIIQVLSISIEYNFSDFFSDFIPAVKGSIVKLGVKKLDKPTFALKVICLWAECEVYKKHFFDFPYCFEALTALLHNPNVAAKIYQDVFDSIVKLAEFGLVEENEERYALGAVCERYTGQQESKVLRNSPIDGFEKKYSTLGEALIRASINQLIDGLAVLTEALEQKKLQGIRVTDQRNLTKKISEFALFISIYCTEGEATLKFYEVTKKSWSVLGINKKTAKPYNKIDSADELTAVKKDLESATNMLKILGGFASKIHKIDEIFNDFILPLVARLEDVKLRVILEEILGKLAENAHFPKLRLRKELVLKVASLHRTAKNIGRPTVDYNKVVEFLIDSKPEQASYTPNEKKLMAAQCVHWLTAPEMSTREKSLEYLNGFVAEVDLDCADSAAFYRSILLESVVYYFQSHFSREHVMKYFTLLLRAHCLKFRGHVANEVGPQFDFTDLAVLLDDDPEKDFFQLVFHLKIPNRGLAMKQLKKMTRKKGVHFKPATIKKAIAKIFDFFLYEYWKETTSASNAYSHQRIDAVRNMLNGVYEIYGEIVSTLEFSALIKFIKDKIFQLDGKSEQFTETSIKIVCSCLEKMRTELPNVMEKIQSDQASLNEKNLQNSTLNRLMEAYNNQKLANEARQNFDLKVSLYADPTQMDLEELQEAPDGEVAEADDEDEAPNTQRQSLSQNQARVLRLHILQPLKKHLCKKDEEDQNKFIVRQEVCLAILQIIKLFPVRIFNTELIGTISKVCAVLADKEEERRKTARIALTSMLKILGPFFLGFFVKELSFHLKRGYEMHIRNYMIYKLIDTLIHPTQGEPIKNGQIDYSIGLVAPLLIDEICGELDEEKEVQEIKNKTIEFKRNKGVDCFKMIAQKIDFTGDGLYKIMASFKHTFLTGASLTKVLGRFNDLGQQIINGLMANPTLNVEAIILFVKTTSDSAIEALKQKTVEEDVELRPAVEMEVRQDRAKRLEEKYKVQEGAGTGQSICSRV